MKLEITFPDTLRIRLLESAPSNLAMLENINHTLNTIMAQLDELKAQVERNSTVEQSAVVLLQGLKKQLDEAGTDPAKLAELSAQLSANTDDLAAAITANTPAT